MATHTTGTRKCGKNETNLIQTEITDTKESEKNLKINELN